MAGGPPSDAELVDGYRRFEVCGWPVFMNEDLYVDDLATPVHDALVEDLEMVINIAPKPSVTLLQDTNIWLELDVPDFPGGVYHPSAEWLKANGFPEKWARGVQLGNARNYLEWTAQQPAMVLHEFAHVLHDLRFAFEEPTVNSAYDEAMAAGSYESVEYVSGGLQQAYATTNAIEYVAELSEAYFWTNDFFPFDRQELTVHDPGGLAAVELLWQVR